MDTSSRIHQNHWHMQKTMLKEITRYVIPLVLTQGIKYLFLCYLIHMVYDLLMQRDADGRLLDFLQQLLHEVTNLLSESSVVKSNYSSP